MIFRVYTDMIINASSLGINKNDKIDLNYKKIEQINFIMMLFIIQQKLFKRGKKTWKQNRKW